MFKNVTRDPLAVPAAVERASQGPTNRRTAGHVRVAAGGPPAEHQVFFDPKATFSSEGTNAVGAGGGALPYGEPRGYQHPNDDPSTQLGWQDRYDQMAEDELHRRHQERGGEGNADPREFYTAGSALPPGTQPNAQGTPLAAPQINMEDFKRNFHNLTPGTPEHADAAKRIQDHEYKNGPLKTPLYAKAARVLTAQAREFLAGPEANVDDASELLYRARRHAVTQTSTWSPEASQRAADAFCARVAELIPNRPKVAAAQSVTHVADFDDQLLY